MKRFFQSALAVFDGRPGIMTAADFTKEFVKALRKSSPGLEVEVVRDMELKVQAAGGKPTTMFLYDAYHNYKKDPKIKEDVMKQFVASFLETIGNARGLENLDPTR